MRSYNFRGAGGRSDQTVLAYDLIPGPWRPNAENISNNPSKYIGLFVES